MPLEQPPPDLAVPEPTPFDHLRPSLWRASKVAHIALVSLGTLMLLPAALVFYLLVVFFSISGGAGGMFTLASEELLALITAVGGSCLGVLAWAALSLLFFKRNDARWQRVCWAFCALFGIVAAPCLLGWIVMLAGKGRLGPDGGWVFLIFISMFGVAIACILLGLRYSRAARLALKHPPTEEDRMFYG